MSHAGSGPCRVDQARRRPEHPNNAHNLQSVPTLARPQRVTAGHPTEGKGGLAGWDVLRKGCCTAPQGGQQARCMVAKRARPQQTKAPPVSGAKLPCWSCLALQGLPISSGGQQAHHRNAPLVSSPHPLAPTAAWPGRASEGRAACCSRGGFRARWHSAKPLAHLSVSFLGWNEGSVGCSEVRLSCLPCSGWR